MKPITVLALLICPLLISCIHNRPYVAVPGPEDVENKEAKLTVYPDDIRTNLAQFTNTLVAWAGVIRSTEAEESGPNLITATTVIDHHYFDWQEDRVLGSQKLLVSPRGEGAFRTEWQLRKKDPDASFADAEKYAAPGKLAIVYGIPEKVDTNGVVVLKYRYLRVVDKNFTTDEFDYGRFGDPFRWIGK